MTFSDGSNVNIRSTDSDNLVEVGTRIMKLRNEHRAANDAHSRAVDAINRDPSLSDHGKQERIDALESERATQRTTGMATEKQIITTKISELERRLDGFVGWSNENIMAFRDAQDRAENIDDPEKAASVMARAIRTNDKTLAHALYRRAVDQRWDDASRAFAADNPAVAQLVNDVQKLQQLHDNSFNRAVSYM